ncbi:MAG TPA: hypothetical protein VMS93_08650, partial [Candidatus Saccharimonadales bacterium]|nr:hypothetical protein [Candidatus Saccharimonadales bacterium]
HSLEVIGENPCWNPEGTKIAATRNDGIANLTQRLIIADSSGHGNWASHGFFYGRPEWSPDGQRLLAALASPDEILPVRDTSGTGVPIVWPLQQSFSGDSLLPAFYYEGWARDASHVAVKCYYQPASGRDPADWPSDYFVADISTGAIVSRLTTTRAAQVAGYDFQQLSPDGRKVLFSADLSGGNRKLYVLDVATQVFNALTNGPDDEFGRWGSDSQTVVFLKGEPAGGPYYLYRTSLGTPAGEIRIVNQAVPHGSPDLHLDSRAP